MKKNLFLPIVFLLLSFGVKAQTQNGWFFCSKCSNLYFGASPGLCGAGGQHSHEKVSGNYILSYGTSPCKGQSDWYWCNKCSSLFFGPAIENKCMGGGKHTVDPANISSYILCYTKAGAVIDAKHQSEWYFCNKCACLFFGQNAGACAAGDKHFFTNETSGNYVLAHL